MQRSKHPIYAGALCLTLSGLLCRFIGFYYKIFLSRAIGAKELGLYQLSMPLLGIGIALANSGIHTAISKYVAGASATSKAKAKNYLYTGLAVSLSLGLGYALICFQLADYIATYIFFEPAIAELLKILAFCVPLECIHGCINGYYYGLQKAIIPSCGQCIEQLIRVGCVFGIYYLLQQENTPFTKTHAMYGLLLGELAATLYYLTVLSFQSHEKCHKPIKGKFLPELFQMAVPVTATRLSLTFLTSFENIMIPLQLVCFGLSNTQALSIYGIYSGMAVPMVFFPTVLSNSIAVMLLPSISRAKEEGKNSYIRHSVSLGFTLCMLLGFACAFFFYCFGGFIGETIFHNQVAGIYIKTLGWLCPFLFLGVTMSSILNGLGNTKDTFFISLFAAGIRLIFIMFFIRQFGFRAFLLGVLISQITSSFLSYGRLVFITQKGSDQKV